MYVHVVYMYVYSDKDNDAGEKIVDTVVTMFPKVTEFLGQSVQICPIQRYRYRAPENPVRLLELIKFWTKTWLTSLRISTGTSL